MEIDVAFAVVQVRVAELPAVRVEGDADSVATGVGSGSAGGDPAPPQPKSKPIHVHTPNANEPRVDRRTVHLQRNGVVADLPQQQRNADRTFCVRRSYTQMLGLKPEMSSIMFRRLQRIFGSLIFYVVKCAIIFS